ncbi:MAG: methyltransferase domain-containing protein [bacterium]|nr:methyltransferase domain-containing protein [bacterium]
MFISGKQLKEILKKSNKIDNNNNDNFILFNLDLNTTHKQYRIYLEKDGIYFPQVNLKISYDLIKKYSKKEELLYLITSEELKPLVFFENKSYRILSTVPPSLEIDGIRMHTTNVDKEINQKIELLKIKRGYKVLDTCCGFGYTAIAAAKKGAKVITIEIDPFIIKLAKLNPYSKELFTNKNITLIIGDTSKILKNIEDFFDVIIHDPPRLSPKTGNLYSNELYITFYKLLKPKGMLFHYVGNVGKKYRNKDLLHTISKRLTDIGFKVKKDNNLQSILAYKSYFWF